MRKKSKQDISLPEAVEMIIKINNENVVIEVVPPIKGCSGKDDLESDQAPDLDSDKQIELLGNLPPDSTPPHCDDSNISCSSDNKSPGPASSSTEDKKITHNKSEKLRRAQLKVSMEKLKLLVPLDESTQKYTTAALLRKSRSVIKKLEERERKNVVFKEQLQREQRYLRKRLEQMRQLHQQRLASENPNGTPATQLQNKIILPTVPSVSSAKPKYSLQLSTSQGQLKTPPILKRKQNLEPEDTEVFYIDSSTPMETKSSIVDLGGSTAYELVTTSDHYGLNSNSISENYCIIIDAGMVQEGFPVSII